MLIKPAASECHLTCKLVQCYYSDGSVSLPGKNPGHWPGNWHYGIYG